MQTIKEKLFHSGKKEEEKAAAAETGAAVGGRHVGTAPEITESGMGTTTTRTTETEMETGRTGLAERERERERAAAMTGPESTTMGTGMGTGTTGMTSTTGITAPQTTVEQGELRTRVRAPVVHEEVRATEEVRVRPEVQREVVRPEIEQVIQSVQEHIVAPTQVERQAMETQVREMPAGRSPEDEARYREQAAAVRDETRFAGVERREMQEQARVSEAVRVEKYQEIQPVIERVVEKPKVVEVTQNVREIVHEAPKVHELKVNAPISITEAEPLLKGQGQPVAPGQYKDYEEAPRAPGEMKMRAAEKIGEKGQEHELKKEASAGARSA